MKIMSRAEFATLPQERHVKACITFEHGADRAAIHHGVDGASVGYTLGRYPQFDSITVFAVMVPPQSIYAG